MPDEEGGGNMIKRLVREEEGQTLVEYGLLVALIALVVIAILTLLGTKVRNLFVTVNTRITSTT
jgi:pilus assembly protein Flp/PilA